jgi:hypothetical protein
MSARKTRALLGSVCIKVYEAILLCELCRWLMSSGTWPCRIAAYFRQPDSRTNVCFVTPAKHQLCIVAVRGL